MRCLLKDGDTWRQETPEDLVKWLHENQNAEAVVIDDAADPKVFYCSTDALMGEYAAKGKAAAMFTDLDRVLFEREPPFDHTLSKAWCLKEGKLCSEMGTCGGSMSGSC